MGRNSKVAVMIFLTLGAAFVSGEAAAQSTCRTTCDNNHVTCMQAGKSDGNVCLPAWQQCKTACASAASAKPVATPVTMSGPRPSAAGH